MAKFQVKLGGEWKDYCNDEDKILKRAYMAGFPTARFQLRGQSYIYDFRNMKQVNRDTNKERRIRQPKNWKAPSKPLVPAGPTTVITVPAGSPGTTIQVPHPRAKGTFISVNVPASARAGQAMLVPVPPLEAAVSAKHAKPMRDVGTIDAAGDSTSRKSGWSTGGKVAAGTAAAGAAFCGVVGGAVLGDHIAEHGLDATVDAAGDGIEEAAEATGDFAVDAGEFIVDAAEDLGDFVMDLF